MFLDYLSFLLTADLAKQVLPMETKFAKQGIKKQVRSVYFKDIIYLILYLLINIITTIIITIMFIPCKARSKKNCN